MTKTMIRDLLLRRTEAGRPISLWLRDDDATHPTPELDRLLRLARQHGVPLVLAVIPRPTGSDLADHLAGREKVYVVQHGWDHANHAPDGEKKQELGPHRPAAVVLEDLACGRAHLLPLYGAQLLPMLVPPWNRIAKDVEQALPGLGFTTISTFARRAPLPGGPAALNTHIDPVDWHNGRGARPASEIWQQLADKLADPLCTQIGLLSHHLAQDDAVWDLFGEILSAMAPSAAVTWPEGEALLAHAEHTP